MLQSTRPRRFFRLQTLFSFFRKSTSQKMRRNLGFLRNSAPTTGTRFVWETVRSVRTQSTNKGSYLNKAVIPRNQPDRSAKDKVCAPKKSCRSSWALSTGRVWICKRKMVSVWVKRKLTSRRPGRGNRVNRLLLLFERLRSLERKDWRNPVEFPRFVSARDASTRIVRSLRDHGKTSKQVQAEQIVVFFSFARFPSIRLRREQKIAAIYLNLNSRVIHFVFL